MKIINISFLALFFFLTISGYSQTQSPNYTPDPRLYECMKKADVDKLSTERSELLLYYNYYLSNSYYVVKLKSEKPVTGLDIHTVPANTDNSSVSYFAEKTYDPTTFNVMKYNFTRKLDGFTTFVWEEAGIALVFYPTRHVQANFKDYLKSIGIN